MPKTIGNFYFKLTDAGNLIGEYSDTKTERSFPESAWRTSEVGKSPFVGDYKSTWYDTESKEGTAVDLNITPKSTDSTGLFNLVWSELGKPNKLIFRGQAMRCDGMLVGNYESVGST